MSDDVGQRYEWLVFVHVVSYRRRSNMFWMRFSFAFNACKMCWRDSFTNAIDLLVKCDLTFNLYESWAKWFPASIYVALSSDLAFETNPAAPWWVLAMESPTPLHLYDSYLLEMHSPRCSRQMLRVVSAALQEPSFHGQARMNLLGMMTKLSFKL